MVLPVSGFLPVPLPMMIPFMGAQSLVIGKMFGEGFQYGKRKISAMPNEEFNKYTFQDMMSNAREEIKASIPTMNAAMQDMQPMVEVVVREFFNYVSLVTKIVTGTGEGEQIFEEEGKEIGEAIAHSLGTHVPSAHPVGAGVSIPVGTTTTGTGRRQTTRQVFAGEEFSRTLAQAQADTSRSRGTGRRQTEISKRGAGQTQRIERQRLISNIANFQRQINGIKAQKIKTPSVLKILSTHEVRLRREKELLAALLARYRF